MTGDILCHEIDWAGNTLWIVDTRFSCLATLEPDYCFVPRWLPPFVSAIVPEDRCHLNGLAIVDDEPRYVTALGQTNSFNGWRDGKSSGACVLDVKESNVVASGLSMAHSPRWHAGRLWLLESGLGLLATIDLASGRKHVIAEFPGFTRGLAIFGRYAFVGLSKIRESAAFGGLPFANKLDDLKCGVWVLDLQSGQTVAFLEFAAGVTELFDVKVLPGVRFPAIVGMQKDTIQGAFVFPPRINMAHGSAPKASSQETSGTQLEKKAGQGASAKSGER